MQRRNRFWIGFLAAAITFGSLMAFVGPRHMHHGRHFHHEHGCQTDGGAPGKCGAHDQDAPAQGNNQEKPATDQ